MFKHLIRLWGHINQDRKRQFFLVLFLMVLTSMAEVISIGAVLPFLGALTSPDNIYKHKNISFFLQLIGWKNPSDLLLPITIIFCLSALVGGGLRLLLLWCTTRLSFSIGADLGENIYRRTLYQDYLVHISRNSSEIINGISSKANAVINIAILPFLTIATGIIMLIMILSALIVIEPLISSLAFAGFAIIYFVIIKLTKGRLRENSKLISRESTQVIKSLQEGLGGIRDVLIDGSQEVYCRVYRRADTPLRKAQGINQFIAASPRYAMEALGMVLIGSLAFYLANSGEGVKSAVPILGVLAIGAQRLLPVLQQMYGSWSVMKGGQSSLSDALDLLDQPLPNWVGEESSPTICFHESIEILNVSFHYSDDTPWVLRKINLSIKKGSKIGFIGVTGSGKSTLLDILMGLLTPTLGGIAVDGVKINAMNCRGWRDKIAHVPQSIYLADTTIRENIAFGVPNEKIDIDRVCVAAKKAQIYTTIESWEHGFDTLVGERGVKLSGGQRQRIGIARALYKKSEVIILDEATSALDSNTECLVMDAINSLNSDVTVLIIAHRVSTLANCDLIVELKDGVINRLGSYQQILKSGSD